MKRMHSVLKFLIRKIVENFHIATNAFWVCCPRNGLSHLKKNMDMMFCKNGLSLKVNLVDQFKVMSKNKSEIMNILKICAAYSTNDIQTGFDRYIQDNDKHSLTTALEKCLESFYPYLSEKKVITLEVVNNDNNDDTDLYDKNRHENLGSQKLSEKCGKEHIKSLYERQKGSKARRKDSGLSENTSLGNTTNNTNN